MKGERGAEPPTAVGTGGSSPAAPALKLVGSVQCRAKPSETTPSEPKQLGCQAPPTLRLGALQSAR